MSYSSYCQCLAHWKEDDNYMDDNNHNYYDDHHHSDKHNDIFQCLAHWKEGSTYYFVAMMNSSHVAWQQLESSFRSP